MFTEPPTQRPPAPIHSVDLNTLLDAGETVNMMEHHGQLNLWS